MREFPWPAFAALALLVVTAGVGHAGGFVPPDTETDPVVTEGGGSDAGAVPDFFACGAACAPNGAGVAPGLQDMGPDRPPQATVRSANTDGRVLCLSLPPVRRAGAGLFALCRP